MAGPVAQFVRSQNPQREREVSALRRQPYSQIAADVTIVGEKIRSSSAIGTLQILPYLDQWSQETYEHRRAYPLMMSDPVVKPALLGKIYAIASLDLQMTPAGETERDEEVAEFCQYAYTKAFDGGFPRLAEEILLHGWTFGNAIIEPVMNPELRDRGKWAGKRFWKTAKAKELDGTNLVWDEFKNIVGVKATRFGQNETFPASDFLIFRNNPMYGGPGTSEFRAAYASWWRKNTVEKIRAIFLEKQATGTPVATYKNPGDKESLEETMANLKDRNWAIVPDTVKVELLALASASSHQAYMDAIKDYDEKICLAISGAFLQMLTANSGKGEMRGNSQSQKSTAELFIWHGAAVVGALIDQSMTPELVRENFAGADFPTVKFGGVNDADLVQSLQVDEGLQRLGYTQDVRDLNSRYARKLKETPPPDMGGGMGGPPGQNDQGPYDAPNGNLIGGDGRQFAEGPTMPHKNGWWKDQAGRWYLWQDGRRIEGNRNRANPDQVRRTNRKPDPRQRSASRQERGQNQGAGGDPGQRQQDRHQGPAAKPSPQSGSDKPQAATPARTATPREQEAVALASKVTAKTKLGKGKKGVNTSYIVTLEDGSKGIWKPADGEEPGLRHTVPSGTYYKREAASSKVAEVLGLGDLVPTTVSREVDGAQGSIQKFKANADVSRNVTNPFDGPDGLRNAAAFDYLIGQTDRHPGNWMLTDKPNASAWEKITRWFGAQHEGVDLVLIDNGLTLPTKEFAGNLFNQDLLREAIDEKIPDLSHWADKWPEVESALKENEIEHPAIDLAKKRFDDLVKVSGEGGTFGDLTFENEVGFPPYNVAAGEKMKLSEAMRRVPTGPRVKR